MHDDLPQSQFRSPEESSDEEDDIHVCGNCKRQFTKIEVFSEHKRSCVRQKKKSKKQLNLDDQNSSFLLAENCILEALNQPNTSERNAEEAAVISLLANQLSNQKPSAKTTGKAALNENMSVKMKGQMGAYLAYKT